jgi:hypothetical protein
LIYHNGRWQDGELDATAPPQRNHCPACRRELDRYPAGLVHLRGEYFEAHREEILNIARNQAALAARSRPLQRVMWMEGNEDGMEIATTNSHLAVRIGKSIERACKGRLDVRRADEDQLARVYWERDS